ncbi:glutamate-ammonia-ligase adenylyltransferase domain protein [Mycobacterium kansasii]|uniref:Glutamate-ammonia-ligase adenylyltransferase domain protein n=1 Tax=Mycobacterium kansasii TaxID=1768 RepID=A0A1V3WNN2_MYCKA|nr:glutamate-ammonia-ligase adenylyltransferase domain protein [Mycobacterium kansasii]
MTKPATQRPKLPSVGRLGLVDPQAGARLTQLGWTDEDDQAHVDLLWSLSRARTPTPHCERWCGWPKTQTPDGKS